MIDPAQPAASPEEIYKKFRSMIQADEELDRDNDSLLQDPSLNDENEDEEDLDSEEDTEAGSTIGDANKDSKSQKKKKKLRRLRRRATIVRGYEFTGDSDISGMIFMEIIKATDLPPERNSKYNLEMGTTRANQDWQ